MNLKELKAAAQNDAISCWYSVPVQITERRNQTGEKPGIEVTLADASDTAKVMLWVDTPAYKTLAAFADIGKGAAVEITAEWRMHSQYGLQAKGPRLRALSPDEMNLLYSGGAAFSEQNERDWKFITTFFQPMASGDCPMSPLGLVCMRLLDWGQEPFRRAAAAHGVHHARRGGLLSHTCSMLRVAGALCQEKEYYYPELTPEILYAGILFHDIGKVFETDYQDRGFAFDPTLRGLLIGHIAMGFCLLVQLWKEIHADKEELLRDHVSHLLLSHHGCKEWGSPVEPVLPEAVILHQIDMMDAGIEKLRNGYRHGETTYLGAVKAIFPMKGEIGLPYSQSAAYGRHFITAAMWTWSKIGGGSETECQQKFVDALIAEGIITQRIAFADLSRAVIDTAVKRWGDLQIHHAGMPSLPRTDWEVAS